MTVDVELVPGESPRRVVPLVTVVIPAYNAAATIRETVESVLQQTFTDFEVLIIDDGSTDATVEVAATITDPRVRLLSFENAGPSASRNRGIQRASGELIAFLDADDLWTPAKLQSQVGVLQGDSEVALAYSWTDCIDETGSFLKHGSHVQEQGWVYEQLLARNFTDNGSAVLVRKRALNEVGLFDEDSRAGEDWDMWLRLANRYQVACVPAVQVLYRVRQQSLMSDVEQMRAGVIKVLHEGLERLPPSAKRERIRRTATASLYKYLAVRLVETGTSRRQAVQAGKYWWLFITTTPRPWRQFVKALIIGGAILAMLILPPTWFNGIRARIAAFVHERAHAMTAGGG